jgi:hypothetical protein
MSYPVRIATEEIVECRDGSCADSKSLTVKVPPLGLVRKYMDQF